MTIVGIPEQIGVGERDAGRDAAVVEQHAIARLGELRRQPLGRLALPGLADGDHVHVGGRDGGRPDRPALVVVLLEDRPRPPG